MNKVIRVKCFMENETWSLGREAKEYAAKRTGLQEVVNFIQKNDRNGDMMDYYKEVLAGEADKDAFLDRVTEYLYDLKEQNKEARLYNDNRIVWKYLDVAMRGNRR